MANDGLTEQQRKWMASVRASLETSTGKTLAQWVEIARACPQSAPRARQKWFKETHGLGQNYAMMVIMALDAEAGANPRDPAALSAALWTDPALADIFAALQATMAGLPELVTGQRKTYTTWSRSFAFAAARPGKGALRLGLAVDPGADPRLQAGDKEGWSERLKSVTVISHPAQVDDGLKTLIRAAWDKS